MINASTDTAWNVKITMSVVMAVIVKLWLWSKKVALAEVSGPQVASLSGQ